MRVLILGTDRSALDEDSRLSKRLKELGGLVDKLSVIVPSEKSKALNISDKIKIFGSGGMNKISQLKNIYKAAKKILREGYDVIAIQDPYYLAFLGLMLARKFKIGLEIQVHGWEKFHGWRKWIAKYVAPRAHAIRVVSQRLKKQLIEEFGVQEDRITVAPIYTEMKFEIRNSKFETKDDDSFIFLTVGRLVPVKNIGMQIEALACVFQNSQIKNLKSKIELWVVGEGTEREKLKVKSEKLKTGDSVKFFGWQDDLDKFYREADAFLLTSDYEGWGLVVIEAASYGLPIIMTDVGCAGEVIKNPSTNSGQASGIVIPVGDKDKLVEAMTRIIENNDLREKLGANARKAAAKLPTKEEALALYKKSWEKALKIKIAL